MAPKAKRDASVGKAKAKAKTAGKAKAKSKGDSKAPEAEEAPPEEPSTSSADPAPEEEAKRKEAEAEAARKAEEEARRIAEEEEAKRKAAEAEAAQKAAEEEARKKAELTFLSLDDIADAWNKFSADQAYEKIKKEDWEVAELDGFSASGPAHVTAKDECRQNFAPTMAVASKAVSLDFSGNALQDLSALGPMWLRNLMLGGNPLNSIDNINSLFPKLICIDLSFVEFDSVNGVWSALAMCPELRSITAESASISSFEDMEPMPSLRTLELVENSIEELDEIKTLGKNCGKGLLELDLRENPLVDEKPKPYKDLVKKLFPNLTQHDNVSTKKFVAKGRDQIDYGDVHGDRAAVDGLYKNESCSCLAGNPCTDPATCKDWANREKVAAESRKMRGLRDESGKQL